MKKNLFLLTVGLLFAVPANAYLTALDAQRILFTFHSVSGGAELSTGEETIVRVDGINLFGQRDNGIDLRTCKVSLRNPAENVLASAEITDEKNGLIKLVAGTTAGKAKLVIKCRRKEKAKIVTVR